ncbi:MAG: ABC transporter ATP-binding protein, partial [Chloroflexi bacterium]|nr:ABC transporter ATP-binding protein [Chloroflexota bacterium]
MHDGMRWRGEVSGVPPQNPGVTVSRALGYLVPYRSTTVIIAVCLIAVALLGSVPPLLIREIIDRALPDGNRGLLTLLAVGMVVIPLGGGLISVLQNHLNASVSQRIMFDIRNQLYTHLQGLSLRFFTSSRTGEIMSRVTDDVAAIQNTVTGSLISIASNFFTVTITLVVIFTLNWQLALIGISLLPLFIIPTRVVGNLRRSLQRNTQRARADLNTHMQETLNVSGFLLMKVFNRERYEADRFQGRSREVMDLQVRQALVGRWFFMLMGLFSFIGPALIYWWGGNQVINGTLTIGTIVAFVAYLARLYGPVSSLATVYVDVQAALALFERIFEYLDVESEITDPPGDARLPRLKGRIQFDNVSFEYVPGRPARRELSFPIESRQPAALVG